MDAVTLGMAKADARKKFAFTSPRLAAWHRVMREAVADSALLVVGDSTGAGLTRWARVLCNKIAAQYPTWTVVYAPFDDTTKTYKTADKVTVQTGSNGRTVTLYNASLSGSAISYARDNISTIKSGVTPDVILVNYGHNSPQTGDDYRAVHLETLLRYMSWWPNAATILMTQNPRATGDSEYANDQTRQRAVFDLAASMGLPVVDVNEAFRLYGNYAADLLLGDGLHPNDGAGSPMWADLVWNTIKPTGVTVLPAPQPLNTRIWLPANRFHIVSGTPTLGVNYGQSTYAFTDSADAVVACSVDLPSAWKRQNIWCMFTSASTGSGGVVWDGKHMYLGQVGGIGGSITLGTWSSSGGVTPTGTTTAGGTRMEQMWNRVSLGASPVSLSVGRIGTSGSDTLAGDALFLGLMIDRAY